jgi:ElaB/YqjD/DUF883 family membrane-anchored ribosome-binding protein
MKKNPSRSKSILENKRFNYKAMQRAALIGAQHGYFFAYMEYGYESGTDIDVAKISEFSLEKVRRAIAQIDNNGWVESKEVTSRMDVIKDIVQITNSAEDVLSASASSLIQRKSKSKSKLTVEIEKLESASGMTREIIVSKTKKIWRFNRKIYKAVKHKKAVYDVLRKMDSKLLKSKE